MSATAENSGSAEAVVPIPEKAAERLFKSLSYMTREALISTMEVHPVPEGREPVYEIISYDPNGQLVLPGRVAHPGTQRLVVH